ncbi:MAG: 50S ribosomal protein L24 [Planctomycetota bacterium]|nr:MAG: 50S ribosomal protein L24 [Planctomycetota bacterium]RKY13705.1 MAG: 50S ribosomal protein L24 [Planctomycetota bacterium]
MARHVKKGDTVEIKAGVNKGATGKVMRVIPDRDRVLVEGVNLAHKHVRPTQKNPQGGRIRIERPIHMSNVQPVNPKSSRGSRVRFETDAKGNKKRVAADGTEIGVVTKAAKK